MEITNHELQWTSENVDLWRQFLETQTGSRLLPKLAELAPTLLEKGDSNELFIRSGKVLGFQESIRALLSLAVIQPSAPSAESAYPDLNDDSKWTDGEKLQKT